MADVFEADAPQIRLGQSATILLRFRLIQQEAPGLSWNGTPGGTGSAEISSGGGAKVIRR